MNNTYKYNESTIRASYMKIPSGISGLPFVGGGFWDKLREINLRHKGMVLETGQVAPIIVVVYSTGGGNRFKGD